MELACEGLYRRHQGSMVALACRRGCDEHEAWDVVQEVFLNMFRRGLIPKLSALTDETQRGWLLRALKWTVGKQRRDQSRQKRGSGHAPDSLDDLLENGVEIACHVTPATEHDRRWLMAVLERGIARLRADMKPGAWAGFEMMLWERRTAAAHSSAMRVAGCRARRRLREIIRRESGEMALYQAASGRD